MLNTPPVPVNQLHTADDLFTGLGGFWSRVYSDLDFVRDYCKGSAELAAQTYLEFLESAAMLGLPGFPTFKRERVVPVVLRRSQRNAASGLYMGKPGINLGPQVGADYNPGTVFYMGGPAPTINEVVYPIANFDVAGQLGFLCNNLLLPTKVLSRNVNYRVENGQLLIDAAADPFENLDWYSHRTVFDADAGAEDVELVVWLTDVLHDKQWLAGSYGYVAGYQQASSATYHDQLSALWSLRTAGSDLARTRVALGGLFGVAAVREDGETVKAITALADGAMAVVTDSRSYLVGPDETLRSEVVSGAVFNRGDYLTETIRLYSSLDTRKFYASNGISLDQFLVDVPRVYLPKGMLGVPTLRSGLTLDWHEVDLVYEGATTSGLPKLKFELAMDPADRIVYWDAVWAACEREGTDLIEKLAEFISNPDPTVPGTVIGKINPLKFCLDNFLGVNLSVLVVDLDAISVYTTALEQLSRLEGLLPAHTMMLMVLHTTVDDEEYDLATARDQLMTSAGKTLAVEEMNITAGPEGLQTRWVRQCR